MIRKLALSAAALLLAAGAAYADPIDGSWKTKSGETAAISGGGSSIVLKTGKHAGKNIGSMKAAGAGKYTGTITDPGNNKTYSGKASLSGSTLKMSGCIAGGLICRTENWKKL